MACASISQGLKGGRLALAAWPARALTLAVSDVPGDDPAVIGSGPTVGDPTSLAEARATLARHGVDAPASVRAALGDPANETPKPGDPRLGRSAFQLILRPADMLAAAALSLNADVHLARHASGAFFNALGDAIVTGPTRTNLADLRVILIGRD
jgi:glycerate-2-kinase